MGDDRTALSQIDSSLLVDRVKQTILEAILENRFGDRLPSEDALGQMLNVSRTTVRAALQSLERHGLIARRRAVGTTVNRHLRPSTLVLERLVGFDWLLRELGHEVEVHTSWTQGPAGGELGSAFELEADTECCLMAKDYIADGVTAIFIRDVVPWAYLEETTFREPLPISIFDFCETYSNRLIDHAVLEFAPMAYGPDVTSRLPVEQGRPFLRLYETHYTDRADIAGYSVIDVNPDHMRLELFRRR